MTKQKKQESQSEPPKKRFRMGRLLKRLVLFILLLIIIPVGIIVVLFLTTDPIRYFELVSGQIYRQYGREINAEEIEISPTKGITLTGISLSEQGGFDEGIAIEFESGSILYNPIALLKKELDILNITVGGFYTSYDNLMSIIEDFSSDSDDPEPAYEPEPNEDYSDESSLFKLTIHEIEVNDSQFLYNDIPLNFEVQLFPSDELFDYEIDLSIESMHGNIYFLGTLHEGNLTVTDLEIGPFLDMNLPLVVNEVKTEVALENEDFYGINGRSIDLEYGDYHLIVRDDFSGTYDNLSGDVVIDNFTVNLGQARLTVDTAKYSTKTGFFEADVSDIEASIQDFVDGFRGDVTGAFSVFYSDQPYITGNIGVTNFRYEFVKKANIGLSIDYNRIKGGLSAQTPSGNLTVDFRADHFINSPYTITVESEEIDLEPALEFLEDFSGDSEPSSTSETESEDHYETETDSGGMDFTLPKVTVTLLLDKLIYDVYEIENINLNAYYDKGIAVIKSFSLDYLNGTLTADATFNNNVLAGNINFKKGKLRQFSELFFESPKKLYGTVGMTGKFRIYLDDIMSSVASLDIMITDGEVKDFIIQNEISQALYNIPLDDIFFDEISFSALFDQETLQLSDFLFYNDDLKVTADGDLRLDDMVLDVISTIKLDENYLSGLPNVTKLFTAGYKDAEGNLSIDLFVSGPVTDPSVSIN